MKCPECRKEYTQSRKNQLYCSKQCSQKRKNRDVYARKKGYTRKIPHNPFTIPSELLSFSFCYPATIQEVIQDESIPNIGLAKSLIGIPKNDLHSVLNQRRVRTVSAED